MTINEFDFINFLIKETKKDKIKWEMRVNNDEFLGEYVYTAHVYSSGSPKTNLNENIELQISSYHTLYINCCLGTFTIESDIDNDLFDKLMYSIKYSLNNIKNDLMKSVMVSLNK